MTGGPFGSTITTVRVLLRLIVVLFSIVSLLVVAAVAVAANSGKEGSATAIKHSVVAVLGGHFEQGILNGVVANSAQTTYGNEGNHNECKTPPQKHHTHATHDRENPKCDVGDDSGSS